MKAVIATALLFLLASPHCKSQESCQPASLNIELEQVLERDQSSLQKYNLADQEQRFAPSAEHLADKERLLKLLKSAMQQNKEIFEKIIADCGWPDARKLSYKANTALFLIVQYGSKDERIRYFPYFEQQYQDKLLNSQRYVMMVDRMRFDQGLAQLYGTQFFPEKSGTAVYGDVFEPEKLNERREQMGMMRIKAFDDAYPQPKQSRDKAKTDSAIGKKHS
ncbi:hypothetical protein H8K47_08625 [Undibacterium sp. CY7W]|uniref:Uncharacterized protein n=1 Tax=Undibacterium rugosum TaxID=2762291 RepID=A0A923I3L4_9BURK|nr:DUF6624 domain-containing protein [Undibacterium rugosum]MBC3935424.1 hypothetical protein [Undibacterium rugosum]